ncbi:DUF6715 family protein [Cellulosilyticum ruminicola]|uniref:DUF6715 family protein n=1 Tax=Cellulosilyticum ruminicola TaxID=425254 RepID=UPI0006CF5327|nr:DUF6715 family protein [Cellulosilyticum ruminicola]
MRKFGIIVFMIAICVAYFFYVKARPGIKSEVRTNAIQVDKRFKDIKENIEEDYPATAKEVIKVYNELLGYAYCSSMKDEYINQYVEDIRLLYSKELLKLNSKEKQIAAIIAERVAEIDKPLVVIESSIETVVKPEIDGKISDTEAQVEVKHSTNKSDILRTYTLVKEDGKWKIKSWKDEK